MAAERDECPQQRERFALCLSCEGQPLAVDLHLESSQGVDSDRPGPGLRWWLIGVGQEVMRLHEAARVVHFDTCLECLCAKAPNHLWPPPAGGQKAMLAPEFQCASE